jgi:hypothetical protein
MRYGTGWDARPNKVFDGSGCCRSCWREHGGKSASRIEGGDGAAQSDEWGDIPALT